MTCIAGHATKKEFREAVAGGDVFIIDPSIVAPFRGSLSEYVDRNGACYVTNHPKRSWFARVTRRPDGSLRVE